MYIRFGLNQLIDHIIKKGSRMNKTIFVLLFVGVSNVAVLGAVTGHPVMMNYV